MEQTKTGYILQSVALLINSITLCILVWSQFLG